MDSNHRRRAYQTRLLTTELLYHINNTTFVSAFLGVKSFLSPPSVHLSSLSLYFWGHSNGRYAAIILRKNNCASLCLMGIVQSNHPSMDFITLVVLYAAANYSPPCQPLAPEDLLWEPLHVLGWLRGLVSCRPALCTLSGTALWRVAFLPANRRSKFGIVVTVSRY